MYKSLESGNLPAETIATETNTPNDMMVMKSKQDEGITLTNLFSRSSEFWRPCSLRRNQDLLGGGGRRA
jgi:hypothetical protein